MNEQSFSMTRVWQADLLMAQLLVLESKNTMAYEIRPGMHKRRKKQKLKTDGNTHHQERNHSGNEKPK